MVLQCFEECVFGKQKTHDWDNGHDLWNDAINLILFEIEFQWYYRMVIFKSCDG